MGNMARTLLGACAFRPPFIRKSVTMASYPRSEHIMQLANPISKQNTYKPVSSARKSSYANAIILIYYIFWSIFISLGKYAFIEASSPRRPGDKAILKIYGSGADRCFFFAYHMSGTGIGSLSVYKQELGRGLLPALLWLKSGDQGADWQEAEINIKGNSQYKVITIS